MAAWWRPDEPSMALWWPLITIAQPPSHSTAILLAHSCAALLASDEWRLSNTGVVSFDVEVCVNSKE